MIGRKVLRRAIEKMKESARWVIVSHENPDGDTFGSAFALCSLAKRTGKDALIVCRGALPQVYSFFPCADELTVTPALDPELVRGALLIAVDISNERRALDNMDELLAECAYSISIDHHADNTRFAALNVVDATASATAEIMTDIFARYGCGMTQGEASALYTALVTDNGNFRFNSTTAASHACARRLIGAGASPSEIDDAINQNMTEKTLRLWGTALSRTQALGGGKGAIFWLTRSEIIEAEAGGNALEGLVNMMMRIRGVKTAVFVTERSGGAKVSFRSRAPHNARALASRFGGGGHDGAAGAKIDGNFEEILERVREEAEKYVNGDGNPADK